MLSTSPVVKTPFYEGPLDLLLELIEKRKLLINDISLAAVTDEYIARLNIMSELPVAEMAQFVSLAATLLLIKSRSLLPQLKLSEGEQNDIQELEYRLGLYQIIKDIGKSLTIQLKKPYLYQGETPEENPVYMPDGSINLSTLLDAAYSLVNEFPKIVFLPNVEVRKIISIEEVIATLTRRISSAMKMSFKDFSTSTNVNNQEPRHDIIISFLALLELVKQGIIRATQVDNGDIILESDTVSTPTYE